MRPRIVNPDHRLHVVALTLFPDMFPGPLQYSIAGKSAGDGIWQLDAVNLRDYAADKHRTVDDTPFGGGPGMVIRADVIDAAITDVRKRPGFDAAPVIYFTPRGETFTQTMAKKMAGLKAMILLCGRYEGIDERVIEKHNMMEISIGDFVLSGGELPAITMLDAVIRLLPGAIGCSGSLAEESFENNLLEAPHYTRPADWQGRTIPEILLSGHHEKISDWRRQMAETITRNRRPDLWEKYKQVPSSEFLVPSTGKNKLGTR